MARKNESSHQSNPPFPHSFTSSFVMGRAVASEAVKRDAIPAEARCRLPPPEIVHIIMEMLGVDRETLSACALTAREFTFPALCCLGRHIAVNTVRRLRECTRLIARGSAFRHVRSLDLGITTTTVICAKDWDDYLSILEFFVRRRTLTRLWLSEVPFSFPKHRMQGAIADIIVSLTATVNELGLYSCRFSCYAEMVSLIRAFHLCTSLSVRDCVARKTPGADIFTKLPQHTLRITDLELAFSSRRRYLIDLSTLVKDAALDISPLTGFSCDASTPNVTRHILMTAVASPIERLQLVCEEALGFHVLADPIVTTWPVKSLTIGPLVHKSNHWCERALDLTPSFPYLESITILYSDKGPLKTRYSLRLWRKMNKLLTRRDLFPRLKRLDICATSGSERSRRDRIVHSRTWFRPEPEPPYTAHP